MKDRCRNALESFDVQDKMPFLLINLAWGAMRKQLRDQQWKRFDGPLPGESGDRIRTGADNGLLVEAVLWMVLTGNPWRDLPGEFGRWNSAYRTLAHWSRARVCRRNQQTSDSTHEARAGVA